MKIVARLMLIAAAVLLAIDAVPGLINCIQTLNTAGWDQTFANETNIRVFVRLCGHGLNALFALLALYGALVGKKSAGLGLAAILLLVMATVNVVLTVQQQGVVWNWDFIWMLICGYGVPALYLFGFLFL